MGELALHWGNLNKFLVVMDDIGTDSEDIRDYAKTWVCSKDGFDYHLCALKPIADVMPKIAGWFDGMNHTYNTHWHGLRDVIVTNAKDIDLTDGEINHAFLRLAPGTAAGGGQPDVDGAYSDLKIHPFEIDLSDPDKPEKGKLDHGTFGKIDQTLSDTRDKINDLIAGVNWCIHRANSAAGLSIGDVPSLPKGDLEQTIVYPLSGDYLAIRQNADACVKVDKAMKDWGKNFTLLSGHVHNAMSGNGALGLIAQLNAYDVVMHAVGIGIGHGKAVFESVAGVSEKIAVVVERVLVKLATKLTKLLSKLGSKCIPIIGWAIFVEEIVTKGYHAVTDIFADVKECIDMIGACKDLVDNIDKWAKKAAEKLHTFQQIVQAVQNLPGVNNVGSIDELTADMKKIRKKLNDVSDFNELAGKAGDQLDDALDDLDGKYPDEGGSDDGDDQFHVDDDHRIVAPGPMIDPGLRGGDLNNPYGSGAVV